ncbi:MAG TPA: transglutaminase-like cysteine peptidase [Xanthobacteraceae bacterium]|nr:transglutaminase-like cysteine peptidase [Xanthobacteraceae bacterium]
MSAINRRAAPRLVTTVLAIAALAVACGGATASGRKPRAADQTTGFGELMQISPLPLSDAAAPPAASPALFFTINKVLAKLDGQRDGSPSDQVRLAARDDTATDAPGTLPRRSGAEPFGMFAFRAPEGVLWTKWRGVAADIAKDVEAMARCRASAAQCSPAATRFIALIDDVRRHDGRARLETVNRAVNDAIRYTSDMEQHGVADLWSAPLATFASGRGDCEDYAIAKYVALRESGVAAEDMRVLLVRDLAVREDHAVLAVREGGRWMILDNRSMAPIRDSEARSFMPLFALDQEGVKLFAAPYVERAIRNDARFVPASSDAAGSGGPGTLPRLS